MIDGDFHRPREKKLSMNLGIYFCNLQRVQQALSQSLVQPGKYSRENGVQKFLHKCPLANFWLLPCSGLAESLQHAGTTVHSGTVNDYSIKWKNWGIYGTE